MAASRMIEPTKRPHKGDPIFRKRVLSALVLAPGSLFLVWIGGQGFAIFIAAFGAAMGWEWIRMSDRDAPPRAFSIATATAVGAALLAAQTGFVWTIIWIIGGGISGYLDRRPRGRAYEAAVGIVYVAASIAMLVSIRQMDPNGLSSILYLLAVVWAADTFAYLVGTWVGGPKLIPIASPNKTWSGLLAGLAFGVLAGWLAAYLLDLDTMKALVLAGPLAIIAVLGDLFMSLAKRRFGVKDAGSLIPGHGGVLDRVDALMLATILAGTIALSGSSLWPGASL